jgi:protein-disulfide isomerase
MSKRTKAAAKAKADKAKRKQTARSTLFPRQWPYLAVAGVAAAFIAALLLVGGGSGSSSATVHPAGYAPPTLGYPDAPVEFVLWEDFQCPFCNRFEQETLPLLVRRYGDTGQVRFVWRNFENYGNESRDAAVAAYCAGEQGQFWEFKDVLFQNQRGVDQGAFSENNLRRFAQEAGLETTAFNSCLDGTSYESVIAADKHPTYGDVRSHDRGRSSAGRPVAAGASSHA